MSFGVACVIPDITMDMKQLIQMADEALYKAKDTGRNKVVGAEEDLEPSSS